MAYFHGVRNYVSSETSVTEPRPKGKSEEMLYISVRIVSANDIARNMYNDKPCGTQSEQGVAFTNIVGGEEARENEFNWMVLIKKINCKFCGGTLITKKHVLTAANSVLNFTSEDLTVTIGEYDRTVDTSRKSVHNVDQIYLHPNYVDGTKDNDIAILELREPVSTDNSWVGFGCLPKSGEYQPYT
ncbi:hypothetical protein QTP88_027893 [Uroleucon formosanum]